MVGTGGVPAASLLRGLLPAGRISSRVSPPSGVSPPSRVSAGVSASLRDPFGVDPLQRGAAGDAGQHLHAPGERESGLPRCPSLDAARGHVRRCIVDPTRGHARRCIVDPARGHARRPTEGPTGGHARRPTVAPTRHTGEQRLRRPARERVPQHSTGMGAEGTGRLEPGRGIPYAVGRDAFRRRWQGRAVHPGPGFPGPGSRGRAVANLRQLPGRGRRRW